MLSPKQIKTIHEKLESAQYPIYIHDDDPDGLCSFLLLYNQYKEGMGLMLKAAPKLDPRFHPKINHLNYDLLVVLDIPQVEQDFIDQAKAKVMWIDHHQVQDQLNVSYFNPRIKDKDAYIPTTRMAYQIVEKKARGHKKYAEANPDFWLAMVGCLSDWHMPDFAGKFCKVYPDLMQKDDDIGTALFSRPIGILAKIFSFIYKGPTKEVYRNIKVAMKIKSPYEILNQTTEKGKYLWKMYQKLNGAYEAHIKAAGKEKNKSPILHYNYIDSKFSFTATLATELQYHHKDRVILITRKSEGKYKCSIRAQFPIVEELTLALEGVEGYGGGHPNACGAVVAEEDWDGFLKRFKEELKKKPEFKKKKKVKRKNQ